MGRAARSHGEGDTADADGRAACLCVNQRRVGSTGRARRAASEARCAGFGSEETHPSLNPACKFRWSGSGRGQLLKGRSGNPAGRPPRAPGEPISESVTPAKPAPGREQGAGAYGWDGSRPSPGRQAATTVAFSRISSPTVFVRHCTSVVSLNWNYAGDTHPDHSLSGVASSSFRDGPKDQARNP